MTHQSIKAALAEELFKIAPDVALDDIDPEADLREEFDIDSMDFLNLVTALGRRFEIPMPEADYPKMSSFSQLADYLRDQTS